MAGVGTPDSLPRQFHSGGSVNVGVLVFQRTFDKWAWSDVLGAVGLNRLYCRKTFLACSESLKKTTPEFHDGTQLGTFRMTEKPRVGA